LNQSNPATFKSFRNVPKVKVLSSNNLNTYEVMNHEVLVLTQETLKEMTEVKLKGSSHKGKV
jgi:ribosomal protein L4